MAGFGDLDGEGVGALEVPVNLGEGPVGGSVAHTAEETWHAFDLPESRSLRFGA